MSDSTPPPPAPVSLPEVDNVMLDYPLVSISYCVRCHWMLRAAWYQQEILQTFGSKQDSVISANASNVPKLTINSVILKPSLIAGTFTIAVKVKKNDNWIVVWDRKMDGGFPDSKIVKQKIRDLVRPGLKMNHLDKPSTSSNGALLSSSSTTPRSGSPLGRSRTFAEECLECTRTWEG
ncbi:DEKNAAC104729 [Brettanomyces naardenensis]|uniref:DEKNAAC104729 n=1 Tax=Brettanomyces naardenensis TaxID=13370 RepID=A0A448YRM7_BRENA|nr:DEKNAAC104729 [Brettanomyces naardenensis]